jgi:hypothetical protein
MIRVIGSTRTGRRAAALAGAVFFLFNLAEAGADADGLKAALAAAAQDLEAVAERDIPSRAFAAWKRLEVRFPIYADWLLQDAFDDPLWKAAPTGGRDGWRPGPVLFGPRLAEFLLGRNPGRWSRIVERVLAELGDSGADMADELAGLGSESRESQYVDLYLRACEIRRARRLQPWLRNGERKVVFARHFNMGGSHYAYTEALSDARLERNFRAGSALCLLSIAGTRATVETLLESSEGVIRDVDVSWDGESILFAWKKSDRGDDYGLYTLNVASREIVQTGSPAGPGAPPT